MEQVFSKSTGKPVLAGAVIKDQVGREWSLSFAARPGIRTNDPDGEVWVRKVRTYGLDGGKPFALWFFPDLTFDKPDEAA